MSKGQISFADSASRLVVSNTAMNTRPKVRTRSRKQWAENQHLRLLPQVSDRVAFKFNKRRDDELTDQEQIEATAVIESATATLRRLHLEERVAMPFIKHCRREVWLSPDSDGWTEDE